MQTINSMDKQQTIEKPKRKQVKNACGKILLFFFYFFTDSLQQSIVKRHARNVMMEDPVNDVSNWV